ncbi:IS66 family insertion sequence element accessory protein TnpA [Yersinia enterocolitica]|uniref:IS66 family insertion sequence element accessory protein TnpA n=1 Tax=Yersinia enterocolitica TaxID=630 RepID=UPI00398C965C
MQRSNAAENLASYTFNLTHKLTVSERWSHIVNSLPLSHSGLSQHNEPEVKYDDAVSRSERQHHLDAWQQRGLSKKQYCRQHDVSSATFYYWLKHHKEDMTVAAPSAFIPAHRVIPENNGAETVTLNIPNGCSVNCLPAQLRAVMRALSLC